MRADSRKVGVKFRLRVTEGKSTNSHLPRSCDMVDVSDDVDIVVYFFQGQDRDPVFEIS